MRAVLDANILVSALLAREGAPGQILRRWFEGELELIISPLLLSELERTLAYRKVRGRVEPDEAAAFVSFLRRSATIACDPPAGRARSADPSDDYLVALAERERAVIVSGDSHLLDLAPELPVFTARAFRERLADS